MARILLIQGANLNWLGIRQPEIYGTTTAAELDRRLKEHAGRKGCELEIFYTNSEGEAIDRLYRAHHEGMDAVVINPGGFTYAGYALMDAIKGVKPPVVEVHISNLPARGMESVLAAASSGVIMGFGLHGYILAIDAALELAAGRKEG